MLMVVQMGRVNLEIFSDNFARLMAQSIVIGNATPEDFDQKATLRAGAMALK